jgi:hypothetical protein
MRCTKSALNALKCDIKGANLTHSELNYIANSVGNQLVLAN